MKKNNNGFTLVELLVVFAIMSLILIIAVPLVVNIINHSKERTIELTAKSIAKSAEEKYIENDAYGIEEEITCEGVSNITSSDFSSCIIAFNNEGKAYVTLVGKERYKDLYVCNGTKIDAKAQNIKCGSADDENNNDDSNDSSTEEAIYVSVDASNVVASTIIGLGISPGSNSSAFNELVNDSVISLKEEGIVSNSNTISLLFVNKSDVSYMVDERIIEVVRAQIFASDIISETKNTYYEGITSSGVAVDTSTDYANAYLWMRNINIQSLAKAAPDGSFLLTSVNKTDAGLATYMHGAKVGYNNTLGVRVMIATYRNSYSPYLSTTYPVGSFVEHNLTGFDITYFGYADYDTSSHTPNMICLSYEDAVSVYDAVKRGDITLDGSYINFLTADTYLEPRPVTTDGGTAYPYKVCNYGRIKISTGGVENNITKEPRIGLTTRDGRSLGYPIISKEFTFYEKTEYVSSNGLTIEHVGEESVNLETGYETWASRSKMVTDNSTLTIYYPIGFGPNLNSTVTLKQSDIWKGKCI